MTEEEIKNRIAELKTYCELDKIKVNDDSVSDFLYYLNFKNVTPDFEGPFIFMTDQGNVRAMWKRPNDAGKDWSQRQEFRLEFHGMGKATLMWMPLKPRDKPVQQVP